MGNKTQSEQFIRSSLEKNIAKCHTKGGVNFSMKEIPISPIKMVKQFDSPKEKRSIDPKSFVIKTKNTESNDRVNVSLDKKPTRSKSHTKSLPPTKSTTIFDLSENSEAKDKKWRFYNNMKLTNSGNLPNLKIERQNSVTKNTRHIPMAFYNKGNLYSGRGEMPISNRKFKEMTMPKSVSMNNLSEPIEKKEKSPKTQNYLEEIRNMALTTIIDKEEVSSFNDDISIEEFQQKRHDNDTSIDLKPKTHRPQTGKNFQIKSSSERDTKEIIYPSSINHIP